jgi:hypothetical protein
VSITLLVVLTVVLAIFLMGVREAVMFYQWLGHLKRVRSGYTSRQILPR